jgi:hypothetical protein
MTTRLDAYHEALNQLTSAAAALDQAHAFMRDALVADIATGPYRFRIRDLANHSEALLDGLKAVRCDECGQHFDECPCQWLKEVA